MEKSLIPNGLMFIQFPSPIAELQETPKPRVWVKVGEEGGYSLFIDNNALVRKSINPSYKFGIRDKWMISDSYYSLCVREGRFVHIDDLKQTDGICEEMGYPPYEIDLGF